jgi:phage terminase large subunit-like protein
MFAITTAGMDTESICWTQHEYAEKILEGVIEDDSFFGLIFAMDEGEDWLDEAAWYKANPNLGVSKSLTMMREDANTAQQQPSELNSFLRLHLDQWVSAESRWLDPAMWKACGGAVNLDGLRGRTCYGGLDLSTTTDISAFVLVFPPESDADQYQVLCRFWIPEDAMHQRVKRDRVPYDVWVRQGFIEATPGNVIDYDYVLAGIAEDAERFDLDLIAFDRWGATKIQVDLAEQGHEIVQFGQGYASMSGPTKELEKLILSQKLAHAANPVLSWMASNVVVRSDPAGNLKPDKEKSREKIDGIVALIMALDVALRRTEKQPSVYERRGMREL